MLFFIDESGHDHGEAPYEILAAVAVAEADLWNLIQAIRAAEIQFFGVHLTEVGVEFKGKKLLKNKTFRHARQGPAIESNRRRDLAHEFLMKGWREQQGGPQETRTRDEFTAYGQAQQHDRANPPRDRTARRSSFQHAVCRQALRRGRWPGMARLRCVLPR